MLCVIGSVLWVSDDGRAKALSPDHPSILNGNGLFFSSVVNVGDVALNVLKCLLWPLLITQPLLVEGAFFFSL